MTLVAAFVAVVAIGGLARSGTLAEWVHPSLVVHAMADAAHGTTVGTPVKLLDVDVGTVTDVAIEENVAFPGKRVRITLSVGSRYSGLVGDASTVALRGGFGPIGAMGVEIVAAGKAPLASGSYVAASVKPTLFGWLESGPADSGERIARIVDDAETVLHDLRRVLGPVAEGQGMLSRLVTDATFPSQVEELLKGASGTMRDAQSLLADAKKASNEAPATVAEAHAMFTDGRVTVKEMREMMAQVPELIAATQRAISLTEETLASFRASAAYAPELARKASDSIDESQRLIEAAQRNFVLRSTLPDRPKLRTGANARPTPAASSEAPRAASSGGGR